MLLQFTNEEENIKIVNGDTFRCALRFCVKFLIFDIAISFYATLLCPCYVNRDCQVLKEIKPSFVFRRRKCPR